MRSLNNIITSNKKLYGKKFKYYDSSICSKIYTITRIPEGLIYSDDDYCWVSWDTGGNNYDWESCRECIEKCQWILL